MEAACSSSAIRNVGLSSRHASLNAVARVRIPRVRRCSSREVVRASSGEKSDNRARQEIEQRYYEEWERLTLVPEEELTRPMTPSTFARFLPVWLRYHALPGPVRYWLFKDTLR